MQASTYADLLRPIPNALAVLQAADAQPRSASPLAQGRSDIQQVQYHDHHHDQQRR